MQVPLRLVVVLATVLLGSWAIGASPAWAKDELKPIKDYNRFNKETGRLDPGERKQRALDYLEAWKASGKEATGTTTYAIAQFQQAAGLLKDAFAGFRAVRTNDELKKKFRNYAANAEANLLTFAAFRSELGPEALDKATEELVAHADGVDDKKAQNKLRGILAMLHTAAVRASASRELRIKIVEGDPKTVSTHVRPIMQSYLSETWKLDEFDALRKKAAATLTQIKNIQEGVLAGATAKMEKDRAKLLGAAPDALDPDGNLKQTDRRKMSKAERAYGGSKRSYDTAKKLFESLDAYGAPFDVLGKPAPAWTLEKAFGDVSALADVKGKVVLLDFWATWCPACNFPVLRDLAKAYGDRGLAIVGVTASSNVVYADRYDFDEDLQSKATGQKVYAARLASEAAPADGKFILEEDKYRAREIEAIEIFVGNHELKWPMVMIDKAEPAAKYGQETWPHLVVLDKEGRVRMLRGGPLARSDVHAVSALKAVIEGLLGEG